MPITLTRKEMTHRLQTAFPEPQTELQRAADTLELKQGLSELTRQVNKLAGAQQRTEQRVEELAEAQTKTDQALQRLEQVVEKGFTDLYQKVGEFRQEVGQPGNRFGFDLEEFVAALLPPYLERHQSISHLTLERQYFQFPDDQEEEIDLVGTGERAGHPVTVLAECRTSLKGGEARKLITKPKRVKAMLTGRETLLILVAMNIRPSAAKAGAVKGVLTIPYSHIYRPADFE